MKTGIELIAEERCEQIEKHGFSVVNHAGYYEKYELLQAALYCIDQDIPVGYGLKTEVQWPEEWDESARRKILAKDPIGRLKVAGAFIAAQIDFIKSK